MITVEPPYTRVVSRAEIVTTTGGHIVLPWFVLRDATWGGAVPVDLSAIASVRLVGADATTVLSAPLATRH
jgi:hypothetical protein